MKVRVPKCAMLSFGTFLDLLDLPRIEAAIRLTSVREGSVSPCLLEFLLWTFWLISAVADRRTLLPRSPLVQRARLRATEFLRSGPAGYKRVSACRQVAGSGQPTARVASLQGPPSGLPGAPSRRPRLRGSGLEVQRYDQGRPEIL